jgi:outer membrane protein assembly factor BamA
MKIHKFWLTICASILLYSSVLAQKSTDSLDFVVIEKIELLGNKKTKPHIIFRELTLKEGDTLRLAKKDSLLARNRANVFNTNLFTIVEMVLVKRQDTNATLKIIMHERWYLFPIPLFELSDRNFNEWWTVYGRDLSRTNYGLRFRQDNFRGRRETIGFTAQFGFTQRFSVAYDIPYLTKSRKLGMTIAGGFGQNRAIAYGTQDNKLAFAKNTEGNARERWDATVIFSYRPAFYAFHNFTTSYQNLWVSDTIVKLNPAYYGNGQNKLRYMSAGYTFRYDKRDAQAYALRGHIFKIGFNYIGFLKQYSLRQIETNLAWGQYFPIGKGKKWYWDYQLIGQFSYNKSPVFARTLAVGYGEQLMRGYELYVIPTQASAIAKQTFKYRFFDKILNWKHVPIPQFRKVPMAMFLTFYTDAGYVHDGYFSANNLLQNRPLYGIGTGLDIVTYYNSVIRINYALNSLGQARLYLNFTTDL